MRDILGKSPGSRDYNFQLVQELVSESISELFPFSLNVQECGASVTIMLNRDIKVIQKHKTSRLLLLALEA